MTTIRCAWCDADAEANAAHHEGPHATWCPHHRKAPLPPSAVVGSGRFYVDSLHPLEPPPSTVDLQVPADLVLLAGTMLAVAVLMVGWALWPERGQIATASASIPVHFKGRYP